MPARGDVTSQLLRNAGLGRFASFQASRQLSIWTLDPVGSPQKRCGLVQLVSLGVGYNQFEIYYSWLRSTDYQATFPSDKQWTV